MRVRCNNPRHPKYPTYGGRGICVCEEWTSFQEFWRDMGPTWRPGLELDRINNNGDYEPDNCRWTTGSQNCRNKRNNRTVQTPDGAMLLIEASERYGLHKAVLHQRIKLGWSIEATYLTPVGKEGGDEIRYQGLRRPERIEHKRRPKGIGKEQPRASPRRLT